MKTLWVAHERIVRVVHYTAKGRLVGNRRPYYVHPHTQFTGLAS